jgi:chromatin remodeling complex protein RSC6
MPGQFNAAHQLSPALEAVVGPGPMSRPDVTKKLWVYIKEHNLQDPANKRQINADDKLKLVFGGEAHIDMMKLAGFVGQNLVKG